jgi:hypothetical protein
MYCNNKKAARDDDIYRWLEAPMEYAVFKNSNINLASYLKKKRKEK